MELLGICLGAVLWLLAAVTSILLSAWMRWHVDVWPADAPAKVATTARVMLIVSPMRASWAELLLCKYAVRNHWQIQPEEGHKWIDQSNLERARKD